jgi:hypothetical protein
MLLMRFAIMLLLKKMTVSSVSISTNTILAACARACVHRRNLANNIAGGGGGGPKRPRVFLTRGPQLCVP